VKIGFIRDLSGKACTTKKTCLALLYKNVFVLKNKPRKKAELIEDIEPGISIYLIT
jgi:hypothetical protein